MKNHRKIFSEYPGRNNLFCWRNSCILLSVEHLESNKNMNWVWTLKIHQEFLEIWHRLMRLFRKFVFAQDLADLEALNKSFPNLLFPIQVSVSFYLFSSIQIQEIPGQIIPQIMRFKVPWNLQFVQVENHKVLLEFQVNLTWKLYEIFLNIQISHLLQFLFQTVHLISTFLKIWSQFKKISDKLDSLRPVLQ